MQNKTVYHAFTVRHDGIKNRLINEVTIKAGDSSCAAFAQWDTGASGTCIAEKVANDLGLVPTGKQNMKTPAGTTMVNTYLIDVILPNGVTITDVVVCGTLIHEQGIQVLIGMDIIGLGDFSVSNHEGKTVYSFRVPSKKTTDYVKEINLENKIGPEHGKGKRKRKKKKK